MSDGKGMPSAVSQPERHAGPADFFVRLWREKPLGIVSGIIVLMLISGGYPCRCSGPLPLLGSAPGRQASGRISPVSAGYRPVGPRLVEPTYLRGSSFFGCRCGGDCSQCCGRCPDRRHFGVPRWQIRPGRAEIRRCLDGLPRTSGVIDHNVHSGPGSATDNTGAGDIRRNRRPRE